MKLVQRTSAQKWIFVISLSSTIMTSVKNSTFCHEKDHGHLIQTKTFSSDVVTRWLDMKLEMLRLLLTPGAAR
ncbi:MAG: hypothetical protein ACXWCG_07365 [Flavitalea sp.]